MSIQALEDAGVVTIYQNDRANRYLFVADYYETVLTKAQVLELVEDLRELVQDE